MSLAATGDAMADSTIRVAVVRETIHAPVNQQGIQVSICEERLEFSAPTATSGETILAPVREEDLHVQVKEERLAFTALPIQQPTTEWPFGPNPIRVERVIQGETAIVDQAAMPVFYRAVKWLLLVTDEANDLVVSSEINCLRKGNEVRFVEFALLGDTGLLFYDLDVVETGNTVRLLLTSRHDGILTIRAVRFGIFN